MNSERLATQGGVERSTLYNTAFHNCKTSAKVKIRLSPGSNMSKHLISPNRRTDPLSSCRRPLAQYLQCYLHQTTAYRERSSRKPRSKDLRPLLSNEIATLSPSLLPQTASSPSCSSSSIFFTPLTPSSSPGSSLVSTLIFFPAFSSSALPSPSPAPSIFSCSPLS